MRLLALNSHSFVLIRHGETISNRDGVIAGRMDVALTNRGRDQARSLQGMAWPKDFILFASPKDRAKETSQLAFPEQEAVLIPDLVERHWGIFEGKSQAHQPPRFETPEGGEGWDDFLKRVGDGLMLCCQQAGGKLPIIVCHSGVVRAARVLTGQGTVGTRPPNARPIHFRWTGEAHSEEFL